MIQYMNRLLRNSVKSQSPQATLTFSLFLLQSFATKWQNFKTSFITNAQKPLPKYVTKLFPNSSRCHFLHSPNSYSSGHPPCQHLIMYQIILVLWVQVVSIWRDLSNLKSGHIHLKTIYWVPTMFSILGTQQWKKQSTHPQETYILQQADNK